MVGDDLLADDPPQALFHNPWPALIAAMALTAAGFVYASLVPPSLLNGIWLLIGPGVLAAGAAVWIRPRSPLVLTLAALVPLLAGASVTGPITDRTGGTILETSSSVPTLLAWSTTIRSSEDAPLKKVVATFRDTNLKDPVPVENYWATINWGDGTDESKGTIEPNIYQDGNIIGTHTYAQEGYYAVKVTVASKTGGTVTTYTTAKVTRWDSAQLLFWVLGIVGGFAALVEGTLWLAQMLLEQVQGMEGFAARLPSLGRRIVVSLVILFHFGGILSAVTNVSPAPWISSQLWTRIYRPYLQFMYLNNAYHFYAPDPGPAPLIWFRIEYEKKDGQKNWRWVKVPELDPETGQTLRPDGSPLRPRVEYTRRLSMAESINYPGTVPPNFVGLLSNRINAGNIRHIPIDPVLLPNIQYRPPNDLARVWLESYVRHVAQTYRHQDYPDLEVVSIKVYRVVHRILGAGEFADGMSPEDPTTYMPFYQGEYDKNGDLLSPPDDAFLYWLIPILKEPKPGRGPARPGPMPATPEEEDEAGYVVKDYLKVHAGDLEKGGTKP